MTIKPIDVLTNGQHSLTIERRECTFGCGPVGPFRDELSRREYRISGLCQECQDKVFGGVTPPEDEAPIAAATERDGSGVRDWVLEGSDPESQRKRAEIGLDGVRPEEWDESRRRLLAEEREFFDEQSDWGGSLFGMTDDEVPSGPGEDY